MKNIKFFRYLGLAVSAGLLLGFSSCSDDDDYAPGNPAPDNCMGVYFDAGNAAEFILTPDQETVDVKVCRKEAAEAASVPVKVEYTDTTAIQVPATVEFAQGEKEATLTISVKGLTPKKKFGFKIDVDEAYADPYTKQDGSTVLQSTVLVSQWKKVLENVRFYYAGFTDLPVTYSDIYQLEGVNQFYITNMLGSGADLYFKINGTFNADNLADCSGELVPVEGKGAAIYDYQTYKQNYIVAGVDSSTGDYLWNWTVGDVNINSFMWYGGYDYSTYSYIDFTQKYIYLNGYIDSSVEQQSVNVYGVW